MGPEIISIAMFAVVCVVLMMGFPVAFSLAGTALAFAFIGSTLDLFDLRLLSGLSSRYFGVMVNEVLVAVPLFVFMGVLLERARLAEQLLETMGLLFGSVRGGLAISVIIVGMLLAASTGIVGATVVTMGLLSLPTMLKAGYDPRLATGTICASGTLGQIIPPSIVLVLLGDILQGAYAEAQRAVGNWAPAPVSVIDLFAGAFLPGMILVGLYMIWVFVVSLLRPKACPALVERGTRVTDLGHRVLTVLLPPTTLILAVLGSILGGIATPTEAAAVGSIGALLLAGRSGFVAEARVAAGRHVPFPWRRPLLIPFWIGHRLETGTDTPIYAAGLAILGQIAITAAFDLRMQREVVPTADLIAFLVAVVLCGVLLWGLLVALSRVYYAAVLTDVMRTTLKVSSMVFVILLGASVFSLVFRGLGGDELVKDAIHGLPGGVFTAMLVVMAVMFLLGFFLDFIEIIFVVVPIVGPIILQLDVN
ncbi:MAG: TRAP transporter large permease subunit, partial [Rhodospirillales bacterium]|nr:TRAP transporter large permease subunit [Rhodospirillales bacterium]